jgi:ParB-like chromosome segregation protein Spo0J
MKSPTIKTFKIDKLVASPENPRAITPAALAGLTKSIERFGLVEPVVVNVRGKTPRVVGGHQRLRALQSLGKTEVLCIAVSCTRKEEKLLNVTLNNPQIQGRFTEEALATIDEIRKDLEPELDLRIDELRRDLAGTPAIEKKGEALEYREETLRPYRMTHILLSFSPELFGQLEGPLAQILKVDGVQYEQGSN